MWLAKVVSFCCCNKHRKGRLSIYIVSILTLVIDVSSQGVLLLMKNLGKEGMLGTFKDGPPGSGELTLVSNESCLLCG